MTKTTKSKQTTRARPKQEEKELFPCKKSVRKNPVNKGQSAAKVTFKSKSSTKADIKIDEKTKKILRNLGSFHKKQMSNVANESKEYHVYDGQLVNETPQGKSETMKAIAEFNPANFFKSDKKSKAKSGKARRRDLPSETFVVDGATGSELDRRGVDCSIPLWSATANLVAHDVLKDVHKQYLMNGAKAITTNTFCTNDRRLAKIGLEHLAKALTFKAAEIAVAARDEVNPDALVLGCVAPVDHCYNAKLTPSEDVLKRDCR